MRALCFGDIAIEGGKRYNVRKYVFKRVLISIFTLLAITLVLFILLQLMPGSPFNDEKLSASQKAALNIKYGLDKPPKVFAITGCMLVFGVSSFSVQ